ncbi:hypothetical protein [Escherichia coli]|uniref:hypothetical protein n=1 Tax=Escherichia coli TaxID=562 RepID=UPI0011C70087|nr:hypothetical protein [Escherichia coli]TXQ70314.1 hypothetical protein FV304_22400 [Escherichia coli]
MKTITYLSDTGCLEIQGASLDILTGNAFADLEIRDSDGHILLKMPAPESGWTHESLSLVQPQKVRDGEEAFDAYLNGMWIGSTEV